MTWTLIVWLAVGAYAFKVLGLVVIGSRPLPAPLERCLDLVPAALLCALVITNTFATGKDLVIDARLAGVVVVVVVVWRRVSFVVVVVLGAATAAILRQVT